jgi:hypothetical protein
MLRAVRAHNGPRLEGLEPIEAWASFRVGRRGSARLLPSGLPDAGTPLWLAGLSDGYLHGADMIVGRWVGLWPGRQLLVVDCWSSADTRARTDLLMTREAEVEVLRGTLRDRLPDEHWLEFGQARPALRISMEPDGATLIYRICWGEPIPDSLNNGEQIAEAMGQYLADKRRLRQR